MPDKIRTIHFSMNSLIPLLLSPLAQANEHRMEDHIIFDIMPNPPETSQENQQGREKAPHLVLQNVFVEKQYVEKQEEWYIADTEGYLVPLPARFSYGWHLRSLSSAGLWVFGEFDGLRFLPLSIWANGRIVQLHTLRGVS